MTATRVFARIRDSKRRFGSARSFSRIRLSRDLYLPVHFGAFFSTILDPFQKSWGRVVTFFESMYLEQRSLLYTRYFSFISQIAVCVTWKKRHVWQVWRNTYAMPNCTRIVPLLLKSGKHKIDVWLERSGRKKRKNVYIFIPRMKESL